jgi:hypothetical protein
MDARGLISQGREKRAEIRKQKSKIRNHIREQNVSKQNLTTLDLTHGWQRSRQEVKEANGQGERKQRL